MPQLRDDAKRVLLKNFPQTEFLNPGGPKKHIPWWRIWDPDW
jgi:outer membrane protein assembly factor BamD